MAARILYQPLHAVEHYYRTAGALPGWQAEIAAKCAGNSRLIFGVSAAFAGPLLQPLNVENGGFHFKGDSSTGKTTLLIGAGSVMGGGGARGFVRTWRATANGLEAIAELHNDAVLLLDELHDLADPREANSIVYMLSNASGKMRMTRALAAQRGAQWRLLFLSSGEIKLSEYVASVGRRIRGGAEVRLLNIPADAGKGMGAFERIHGAESAAVFADRLIAQAKQNYGHALRAFLTKLVCDRDGYANQARAMMRDFIQTYLPEKASAEVGRGLRRFALVAAAGELASEMGVTGWSKGEAWWGAGVCVDAWLADRGGAGASEIEAAIVQVRSFIALNGASRFQRVVARIDTNTQDEIPEKVINRAGFWQETTTGKDYLIFPDIFKKEVCQGFDYRVVAAELEKQGWLRRSGTSWMFKARAPEGSWFFCVHGSILNKGEDDLNEGEHE